MLRPTGSLLALSAALCTFTTAQTVLLREGDPAPAGITTGGVIKQIGFCTTNDQGGFACSLRTHDGTQDVDAIWGRFASETAYVLREEGTVGPLTQTAFIPTREFGLSSDSLSYASAFVDGTGTPNTALWVNDDPVWVPSDPTPGGLGFNSTAESCGMTSDGRVHFFAQYADAPNTFSQYGALWIGSGGGLTTLYESGVTYPNIPHGTASRPILDYGVSANGAHSIAILDINGPQLQRSAIAIDGVGLLLNGEVVMRGVHGWEGFADCGVNDAGDYHFTGRRNSNSTLYVNGVLFRQSGDVVDGQTLVNSYARSEMNEAGDVAYMWNIPGASGNRIAMFVNDSFLLAEGDAIDWDGDGSVDPNATVSSLFLRYPALGVDGTAYIDCEIDVNGTLRDALIAVGGSHGTPNIGTNYCTAAPNSTGVPGEIAALGSPNVAMNNVTLRASSLPPGAFGIFVTSQVTGFMSNPGGSAGNLCLGGAIGRYQSPGQIQGASASGTFALGLDVLALATSTGSVAAQPGETWNFQAWHRDVVAGAATSNFTDAVTVAFQ